nr:glycosyltransferase [Sunxiuqinia sp.]
KYVTTIIRALNYIIKFPNLKLIVVGDGPSKSRLVEISEKIGVAEKVIFVGNQSNPYPWIKNADLLILSSKFEGLPTVLVEALILNIPIISSDCKTGPNEILQKGELGMLFPVGDHILLAKKIEQMLSSTKLRDEFIGKYEQSLNRFSGESILAIFRRMTDET